MLALEFSTIESTIIALLVMMVGACIGSFLNVVIIRLPNTLMRSQIEFFHSTISSSNENNEKSLHQYSDVAPDVAIETINTQAHCLSYDSKIPPFFTKRSQCLHCEKTLRWFDNLPIVSYFLLKGKCRNCQQPIKKQYPIVEALTACVFLAVVLVAYIQSLPLITTLSFLGLSCALIVAAVIDAQHKILPDEITLPFLWLGLLVNINVAFVPLSTAVMGAVIGYLSLWSLYKIHYALTKREGLGYGDFKFVAMFGAWFGAYALSPILLIASVLGIVFFIIKKTIPSFNGQEKESSRSEIPFGPFLSIAAFLFGLWTLFFNSPL